MTVKLTQAESLNLLTETVKQESQKQIEVLEDIVDAIDSLADGITANDKLVELVMSMITEIKALSQKIDGEGEEAAEAPAIKDDALEVEYNDIDADDELVPEDVVAAKDDSAIQTVAPVTEVVNGPETVEAEVLNPADAGPLVSGNSLVL